MDQDISHILENWKYQSDDLTVRIVKGEDGHEKIQLRLDLGILQMEIDGRPDGRRPFTCESLYNYYHSLAEKSNDTNGEPPAFVLDSDDCAKLWQEAVQYYHRYLCFFQLEDYQRAARDTERNITVFDFVADYAIDEEDIDAFEQYRGYVLMMNTRARALIQLRDKNIAAALDIIEEGIDNIRDWFENEETEVEDDSCSEILFLQQWADTIRSTRPLTKKQRLERALEKAVSLQDYERAAKLRDELSSNQYLRSRG